MIYALRGGPSTYSPHICFLHLLVPWFQCQWAAAWYRGPPAACSDPTHGRPPPGASDASRSRPESSAPYRSAHRWTGAAPQRYSTLTWRDLTGGHRMCQDNATRCMLPPLCTDTCPSLCSLMLHNPSFALSTPSRVLYYYFFYYFYYCCCSCWSEKKWTCSKLTLRWVSIQMRSLMTHHPSWSIDCNDRKTLSISWWIMWEMRLINKHSENHTWIEWNLHSCWNCFQRDCCSETLSNPWQHTCNSWDNKYTHPSSLRNVDRIDLCPQSLPKITPKPVCFARFFVP